MSGIRAITPAAAIDHELMLVLGMSLRMWCDANGVTPRMLDDALHGKDPFGVIDMLAAALGVLPESLPRAA